MTPVTAPETYQSECSSRSRLPRFLLRFSAILSIITAAFLLPAISHAADQPTAETTALSPKEAQQILGVLNDPQKREEFTRTLSLIAKGTANAPSTGTVATTPAATVNNATLHHGLISSVTEVKSSLKHYASNFISLFADLQTVGQWFRSEISNPEKRKLLLETFWQAGLIIAVALLLEWSTVFSLRKPLRMITARAEAREGRLTEGHPITPPPQSEIKAQDALSSDLPETMMESSQTQIDEQRTNDQRRQLETLRFIARVPYTLGHILLKLVPISLFMLVAFLGATFTTGSDQAATVTQTLAQAYVIARGLYILVESILAPRSSSIRLAPLSDSTARTLTRWWNVLVAAPSIVICLSVLGGEFDLAPRGTEAMIRAVVLVEHLILAAFIWRLRPIVARNLAPKRAQARSNFWSFILMLAQFWWIPALFLDGALWLIWAAHLRGGYEWILRTTLLTLIVCAVTHLAAVLAYGWQDKLFRISPEAAEKHPELQTRVNYYYPFARGALTAFIAFTGFVALTEVWGIDSIDFFFLNQVGSRLLSAAVTMVIAIAIAAMIWEVVNSLLNGQISKYTSSGQVTRATRLRTVLPIIRTVLLTVIIVIVLVTSLSQIGINVTPLLTGAGIMGAAIAFGSQSLVKDFITGFFMLVEDAIQVGDWVTAGGVSGWVEHLSIRTLRVRAWDGDLHIIPFSSVSSIANTARDWNQIIVYMKIDITEDVDRVAAYMKETVKEMRQEDRYRKVISSDYEHLGVDQADETGVKLVGTIKTVAMAKWGVKRDFYARLCARLRKENVLFYNPTSYTASAPGTELDVMLKYTQVPPFEMNQPPQS